MSRRLKASHPDAGLGAPRAGLLETLERLVPGEVRSRSSDRLAMAHDASHYLMIPDVVVSPRDADQLAALLGGSHQHGLSLTFRSGGTSLSGQGVSSGVLVDTRRHFRTIEVLDDGLRVRVQPGATVRQVNARLASYRRRLGPDPASEAACTIGGVVANNSSGITCGTELNSYRTLASMVLVLPSGTTIDSAAPDADARMRALEPELHVGLARLRDRVRADPASMETIRRQFALKNTMGYGVNSFVDHTLPVDILTHLVIGSEGTLAFVAEATFHTVPLHSFAATGLLVFPTLRDANNALPELVASGFTTIELLDATSLRVAQRDPKAGADLRDVGVVEHAALLVELQAATGEQLADQRATAEPVLSRLPLERPTRLSVDAARRAGLWHIRKGLYAAVAGARPAGTTALLEDIAVPVPDLADTCEQLSGMFARHGYSATVIFGHAKDGNIHFLLNESFADLGRYVDFTEDLVELVLGKGGTLKAEHGTGRIMAPFVRRQYGDELYEVMVQVKRLCDPHQVLSPGVLLNDDPRAHIVDLKITPTVEAEVDRCVECGYCEPVCPSADLTLTPRQRIVLRRELAVARSTQNTLLVRELERDYAYDGLQTCAADGMCQTACPVQIDTGQLVRRLRAEDAGRVQEAVWLSAARHWGTATRAAGSALALADHFPSAASALTRAGRRLAGTDAVPLWERGLPAGGSPRLARTSLNAEAVFFPSCTGTMFGPPGGSSQAFLELCGLAGVAVSVPGPIKDLCCGTPWKSKGNLAGYRAQADRVIPSLLAASGGGTLPVICDASSCTEGLRELLADEGVAVLDAMSFVSKRLLPHLPMPRRLASLAVHPTCSGTRMGDVDSLLTVAAWAADEVVVPEDWRCCGFAGDRGMLHPELTASATAPEASSLLGRELSAYASTNRPCEIGMTRATGKPYVHLLEVLAEAVRPLP